MSEREGLRRGTKPLGPERLHSSLLAATACEVAIPDLANGGSA